MFPNTALDLSWVEEIEHVSSMICQSALGRLAGRLKAGPGRLSCWVPNFKTLSKVVKVSSC